MAVITPDTAGVSMDTSTAAFAAQITGLYAGAAIAACSPCYIKGADGKVYPSDGTAADEKAVFAGICPVARSAGQPVTLFGLGARFHLAATGTLTPGTKLFLSTTAGSFQTTASTGDAAGKLACIDDTDVRVIANA